MFKGIKNTIAVCKMYNNHIIYYNSSIDRFFVTEHEIIYPYEGLYCISQMMKQQGYIFDGTINGLKTFMSANEYYFSRKEVN